MLDFFACPHFGDNDVFFCQLVGWEEDRDLLADDFRFAVAEHLFRGAVPRRDDPVQRLAENRIVRRFHDRSKKLRLIFARRLFRHELGKIVDDADEDALAGMPADANRQVHGKDRTVLALSLDLAADADDARFAGAFVVVDVAVMPFAVGRGHQHFDVASEHLVGAVLEQPSASIVVNLHGSAFVDHHDAVDGRGDERVEQRNVALRV